MIGFAKQRAPRTPDRQSCHVLGVRIDATSYGRASNRVLEMAKAGERGYICAANVHMVMEAQDHADFKEVINGATLVTPDGMPLVWLMRRLGIPKQERVYGPTLMIEICRVAAASKVPVGLFGGKPAVLDTLCCKLTERFPTLEIVYKNSPPFRQLTELENEEVAREVVETGAKILFVGLGCPKQERWMAASSKGISAVMLGVGAAFELHAGVLRQAPALVQKLGFEWAFRLAVEPRRLWRRYLRHNPRFVARVTKELLSGSRDKI